MAMGCLCLVLVLVPGLGLILYYASSGRALSLRGSGPAAPAGCRCTNTSDECWPAASAWASLNASVGGRLIVPESQVQACLVNLPAAACSGELRREAQDEYFNQDLAGAYQIVGWSGAWRPVPSTYAVAAESADDMVAAVRFAGAHNLRLVVKNTGHDYLGRSSAEGGSLLVWTHRVVGTSWSGDNRTVTVQAGVVWGSLYLEAQARGRYVQGGWCPSVGASGGFTLGGGYGPFSKAHGTGADNLLAATVVLASGELVNASSASHTDLFWALRGGGGGTFGVVTSMTYRTHPAPLKTGVAKGLVECKTDAGFADMVKNFTVVFSQELVSEHWGGIATFGDDVRFSRRSLYFYLPYMGLDAAQVRAAFSAFAGQVASSGVCGWQRQDEEEWHGPHVEENAMTTTESGEEISKVYPTKGSVSLQDGRWYDPANLGELNLLYTGYTSQYMPMSELEDLDALASKLVNLSEFGFDLHINKGLGNGSGIWAGENTSYHPVARESAALVLRASSGTRGMNGGVHGHDPALPRTREHLDFVVNRTQEEWHGRFAMDRLPAEYKACLDTAELTEGQVQWCWAGFDALFQSATVEFRDVIAPGLRRAFPFGSYLNEADYWEPDWQRSLWGSNYPRLRDVKLAVDPEGLFFCHHCVGSESWDAKGNCRA